MTFDDLAADCWFDLPPLRKRLAGRDAVRQMLADAVAEWDGTAALACQGDADRKALEDALVERVKTRRMQQQEYRFVLMSILLTAVLVAVVQWLVKWWLDRNFSAEQMDAWRREVTS